MNILAPDKCKEDQNMIPFLSEMQTQLDDLNSLIDSLKTEKSKKDGGIEFIVTKTLLDICYCTYLSFYMSLRLSGVDITNHPVIQRLIKLRTICEKIRPIDNKLKYKIEKIIQTPNITG
eukprot:GHVL01036059.1.p1 GENE.GHVL01036059.1~~GHVL01036059.1.p1  ORF type:complete len:119 (+),score=17.50 GHVL01036059.1:54-410(+)